MKQFDAGHPDSNNVGNTVEPTAVPHTGNAKIFPTCASDITADMFNDILQELVNAVEASGITLDGADRFQLAQAIQERVDDGISGINQMVRMYRDTAFSVTSGVLKKFDGYVASDIADPIWVGQFNLSTGLITIPSNGRYRIQGTGNATAVNHIRLQCEKNASAYLALGSHTIAARSPDAGGETVVLFDFATDFVTNDTVSIFGELTSSGDDFEYFDFSVTKLK